jgi:hypothetical protein
MSVQYGTSAINVRRRHENRKIIRKDIYKKHIIKLEDATLQSRCCGYRKVIPNPNFPNPGPNYNKKEDQFFRHTFHRILNYNIF